MDSTEAQKLRWGQMVYLKHNGSAIFLRYQQNLYPTPVVCVVNQKEKTLVVCCNTGIVSLDREEKNDHFWKLQYDLKNIIVIESIKFQ